MDIKTLIKGLNIIIKYEPNAEIYPNYDQIWVGEEPELVSESDTKILKDDGWFISNDDVCDNAWSHFC